MTLPNPITFGFPATHPVIGPGLAMSLFFPNGPPGGNIVDLQYFTSTNTNTPFYLETQTLSTSVQQGQRVYPMSGFGVANPQQTSGDVAFSDDHVSFSATTRAGTTETAFGTGTATWEGQQGIGYAQQFIAQSSQVQGGFTETDRTQLQAIATSTVLDNVLDALTLEAFTQGPQGGFVSAQLPRATWGILIRLATVPANISPQTPDGQYWVPTLASVRIFRGSDIWLRIPIHTPSKIINIANEGIAVAISNLTATTWLLDMTLQVNFLPGVTGEVFRMFLPV